ncbi:MAG: M66 family metalloprotease [Pirellulales bacterium]
MRKNLCLTLLMCALWCTFSNAVSADKTLIFNTNPPTNDLKRSLAAQVLFAQSQIIPARVREGDTQPHLVGHRKCLVMVRPLSGDGVTTMQVAAVNKDGNRLGILDLNPPDQLPKTAYSLKGLPREPIDFQPQPGTVFRVNNNEHLKKVSKRDGTFLYQQLKNNAVVEIQTADGRWVRNMYLPQSKGLHGKMVRVRSNAGYASIIHYSGRTVNIARSQVFEFKAVDDQWILESELENQSITYAAATWSGVLPADWIVPGVSLWIRQGAFRGQLEDLKIGSPSELILHTIDLGMLVPPRNRFEFANDPTAHREYFQTVPTSRMIVSQYAPLFLRQVMLPDGTLLVEKDPGTGGWHTGTMRQHIGKELISHGIDNANYGVHSTAGAGEGGHPYLVAQLAAHNSSGKYSNGLVTHGGSGGGGIVTLDKTLGNEFSHEVGHNYGLGHYVGGFLGSVHRSADQINSTWGWDADKNYFLPNFSPNRSHKDTCLREQCQRPFHGRSFGLDAMAGGAPLSSANRFTLYTPYSASLIQSFFESKAVFDAQSPTGFRKWNADTSTMEPYRHTIDIAEKIDAAVNDLSLEKLASLLNEYDLVTVSMQDGKWKKQIELPPASRMNQGHTITIHQNATYDSFLLIDGKQIKLARGFRGSYSSNGEHWKQGGGEQQQVNRKPKEFGIPVTTLVGYYDPRNELVSYIYPALHGAYGFTYPDDDDNVTDRDCCLLVETRDGTLRFRLANHRIKSDVMNKFHVNIAESSQPRSVSIICQGQVVDRKPIAGLSEKLVHTIHGE